MSDSTFGFLLMVPALLVLLVVIAFPILKGIYASFCDYGLKELRKGIFDLKWNNFANYKIMLQNNQIFTYFKNTFVFVALVVVIQLVLGMGIALLLDSKIKARGTLRGLMLVPWTIPSVVTAIVWRFMTNSSYGVINWIAYKLGMIPTLDYSWTLQSGSAMALIVIAAVWRQLPYMMVMILAGLQSVDKSLLEAGTIDGASRMRVLLHILLPLVVPGLVAVGIYTFLNAWDDYLMALTIMKSNEMRTLPVGIAQSFLGEYSNDYGGLMAFAVAGSLPIVLLFIFFQKYLVSGMTAGAVKG
jgi:ABC sugar transporter